MNRLAAWGIEGIGEVVPGDQVGDIVVNACQAEPNGPQDDILDPHKKIAPFSQESG